MNYCPTATPLPPPPVVIVQAEVSKLYAVLGGAALFVGMLATAQIYRCLDGSLTEFLRSLCLSLRSPPPISQQELIVDLAPKSPAHYPIPGIYSPKFAAILQNDMYVHPSVLTIDAPPVVPLSTRVLMLLNYLWKQFFGSICNDLITLSVDLLIFLAVQQCVVLLFAGLFELSTPLIKHGANTCKSFYMHLRNCSHSIGRFYCGKAFIILDVFYSVAHSFIDDCLGYCLGYCLLTAVLSRVCSRYFIKCCARNALFIRDTYVRSAFGKCCSNYFTTLELICSPYIHDSASFFYGTTQHFLQHVALLMFYNNSGMRWYLQNTPQFSIKTLNSIIAAAQASLDTEVELLLNVLPKSRRVTFKENAITNNIKPNKEILHITSYVAKSKTISDKCDILKRGALNIAVSNPEIPNYTAYMMAEGLGPKRMSLDEEKKFLEVIMEKSNKVRKITEDFSYWFSPRCNIANDYDLTQIKMCIQFCVAFSDGIPVSDICKTLCRRMPRGIELSTVSDLLNRINYVKYEASRLSLEINETMLHINAHDRWMFISNYSTRHMELMASFDAMLTAVFNFKEFELAEVLRSIKIVTMQKEVYRQCVQTMQIKEDENVRRCWQRLRYRF